MTEFDAATAAVQAALDAGARYADARVMHRRYESMTARNGDVEELTQDESIGLGVRALVGVELGLPRRTRSVGRRRARRRPACRADRRGERAGARPAGRPGAGRARSTASWASGCQIDPLGVPLSDKGDLLVGATAHDGRARRRPGRGALPDLGHREVVRLQRGPPHRPAHPRVRRRHLGHRDRRRRDAAPLLAELPRAVRHHAAGSWSSRSTWPRTPRGSPRSPGRCSPRRPARPARPT